MHYGLSPAILIISLTLILCEMLQLRPQKYSPAYIIGTLVLMYVFVCIMGNEDLMNFSFATIIPDVAILFLFGYFKAK